MAMVETIVAFLLVMLLLVLIVAVILCKPWRYFSRSYRSRPIKIDDLERPLVREETNLLSSPKNDVKDHVSEHNYIKTEGNINLAGAHGLSYKPRISSQGSCLTQGGNLTLDIDTSEDLVGQTLKRPSGTSNLLNENLNYNLGFRSDDASFQGTISIGIAKQGSSLTLEVISGPSQGLNHSVHSTNTNKLPLTLGRVPPSDLLLRDSVSKPMQSKGPYIVYSRKGK